MDVPSALGITRQRSRQENATNILSWLRKRNMEITGHNLNLALQNVISSGHLGHAPLVWKRIAGLTPRSQLGAVAQNPHA
jgi:hypothetical protein